MAGDTYEKGMRDFLNYASSISDQHAEAGKALALAMLADAIKDGCATLASVGLRKEFEEHEALLDNIERLREQLKDKEKT